MHDDDCEKNEGGTCTCDRFIQIARSRMLAHLAERGIDVSIHEDTCDIRLSGNCDCEVGRPERELRNARVLRMWELMRKHTKSQLLSMAFAGGLMNYNSPAKWSKQEIASVVADQQLPTPRG